MNIYEKSNRFLQLHDLKFELFSLYLSWKK